MTLPPQPDDVAIDLAGANPPSDAVTFRGYLGENPAGGFRLYTRPSFDTWLELAEGDILSQVKGSDHTWGESLVFVRRDSKITKSYSATAVEHAHDDIDPSDPAAGYYPRR